MNGQKNILSIIIAVVITVFGCYFFLPSYSSKQLEISYETTLQQNKKDYEKQIIANALKQCGSFNAAAKMLKITHKTVAAKARKYGLVE